jgi:hypothetical protein
MILSEAITRINYALRGTDDDSPTFGQDESNYWLSLINRKKDELYYDTGKQWSFIYKSTQPDEPGTVATTGTTALTGTSTYFLDYNVGDKITVDGETVRTIDTITSNTALTVTVAFSNTASGKTFTRTTVIDDTINEYSVHRNLLGVSDKVYVLDTNSKKIDLDLIHPQERDYLTQQVHLSGGNPQVITFTEDIVSGDSIDGGSLIIPGYYMPADLTTATEVIPIPDPNWMVAAVASEIAFADIVYEDRAETLNSRANALWNAMIARNRQGSYGRPRKTPYSVKRITGTRRG